MDLLKLDKEDRYVPHNITDFVQEFIKKNCYVMKDEEIAEELLIHTYVVKNIRLNLGLRLRESGKKANIDISEIDEDELIEALAFNGFTVAEFIKIKKWNISRSNFYFILKKLGINLEIEKNRTHLWYARRYVRLYPKLLDEDWMRGKTEKDILKELKLGKKEFNKIKRVLNLNIQATKIEIGVKTVNLFCKYCAARFQKRFANYKQALDAGQENFFCMQSHYFAYLKESKKS